MRILRRSAMLYTGAAGLCLASAAAAWISFSSAAHALYFCLLPGAVVFGVLAVRALRCLSAARLIEENEILRIASLRSETVGKKKGADFAPGPGIVIVVSCFGILAGDRVVRYNTGGIHLTGVEIDPCEICLTCEKGGRRRKIRILCRWKDREQMKQAAQTLFYETGAKFIIKDHAAEYE